MLGVYNDSFRHQGVMEGYPDRVRLFSLCAIHASQQLLRAFVSLGLEGLVSVQRQVNIN